jgi:hypothetical protein
VNFIDCRGTVGAGEWHDELHPKNEAFRRIADLFHNEIEQKIALDSSSSTA